MKPEPGARFLFELDALDDVGVVYRVVLSSAESTWQGVANVVIESGAVTLDGLEGAPEWIREAARAFLRGLWNARRGPEPSRWPRRVTRWRAAPRR